MRIPRPIIFTDVKILSDMMHKPCEKCESGTYYYDFSEEKLDSSKAVCTKCGHTVKRLRSERKDDGGENTHHSG